MQEVSPILQISPSFKFYYSMCSPSEIAEISANFSEDFNGKLKFNVSDSEIAEKLVEEEESLNLPDCIHDDDDDEKQQQQQRHHHDEASENNEGEESEEDDDEFEFSFGSTDPDGSPISADDIFSNGVIQPMFPLFNRDLLFTGGDDGDSKASSSSDVSYPRPPLRKIFVDLPSASITSSSSGTNDSEENLTGEYCVWTGKAVQASPDVCKKSNSTGFSRLWRFRDLLHRSSSDGKDAYVFLQNCTTTKCTKTNQTNEKVVKVVKVERREVPTTGQRNAGEVKTERRIAGTGTGEKVIARLGQRKTVPSPHEQHYARNRATKEGARRRSYLPYRQDLVGFFTNVNGLSRNVHPF